MLTWVLIDRGQSPVMTESSRSFTRTGGLVRISIADISAIEEAGGVDFMQAVVNGFLLLHQIW